MLLWRTIPQHPFPFLKLDYMICFDALHSFSLKYASRHVLSRIHIVSLSDMVHKEFENGSKCFDLFFIGVAVP